MAHQKPKATPTQQTIQRASIEWRIWLSASKSACGAYGGSLARYVEERCAVSPSPVGVRVDYLTPFCHRGLFCPLLVSGLVFGTSWCLRCVTQSPVCVVQRSSRCFGFSTLTLVIPGVTFTPQSDRVGGPLCHLVGSCPPWIRPLPLEDLQEHRLGLWCHTASVLSLVGPHLFCKSFDKTL